MTNVLIAGGGKIGALIACFLIDSKDYDVYIADIHNTGTEITRLKAVIPTLKTVELDMQNKDAILKFAKQHAIGIVISSLPYYCNVPVAEAAREGNMHYFDLTEDVKTTNTIKNLAANSSTAFVPQCGLAPGVIGIIANHLMKRFDTVDTVKMRVGALPVNSSNGLHYSLTWSTDGLINEYGNPCQAIEAGQEVILHPLEGLESVKIDGVSYEAFNTSGGLGSLAEIYSGKINRLNYKTLRYPGHCEKIRLLMNDLDLNNDRATLKRILENSIPKTYQDVVVIYVSVTGKLNGALLEENYVNKVYPQQICNLNWSAIQVTTAAGICAIVDLVNQHSEKYHGFIYQESFSFDELLKNRFGRYYAV